MGYMMLEIPTRGSAQAVAIDLKTGVRRGHAIRDGRPAKPAAINDSAAAVLRKELGSRLVSLV
jgi:hypothetical protein